MSSSKTRMRSYRRWSPDERRAIALESCGSGSSVSAVAKKYGISAVSLYLWRKELGKEGGSDLLGQVAPATSSLAQIADLGAAESALGEIAAPSSRPRLGSEPVGLSDDERVRKLELQLAELQSELQASRRQRALLVSVLTSIGSQLKLVAEIEEASLPAMRSEPKH